VDDDETVERCLRLGVDAVYTNRPREIKTALEMRGGAAG
jgi:glycerophosphoryl diester phosphodiesterase